MLLLLCCTAAAQPDTPATCTETAGPTRALGLFKPGEPVGLKDGFRDPPPISRAQCWWQCFGSAFTKKEITRQLEQFKAKGMGGVTIKDTLHMPRDDRTARIKDVPYLSPEWLDMFAHIVSECGRLGLICRCRLGSGWNEGGPWVTPEMSSQMLAFVESEPIVGPRRYTGLIPRTKDGLPTAAALAGDEAFVVAVPEETGKRRIDLTAKLSKDGTLVWDVPDGVWKLVSCYSKPWGHCNVSTSPSGAGLHYDHLSKAQTDACMADIAERMLARLVPVEQTAFDGLNHDSWEIGNPTWTPGFRREFIARRGYDPAPYLPVLLGVKERRFIGRRVKVSDKLTDKDLRFLYDLRTTAGELIIENFYIRANRWCRDHGVAFEAEAGGPFRVPKDLLRAQGSVDIPMGEFWMTNNCFIKVPSSAAHAYGKRLVGMESLTHTEFKKSRTHLSNTPAEMKRYLDKAFLLGGNYITLAVVEYSPLEAGLPGWVHNSGPHLNHCQTWWPMAQGFFDYAGRCCFMLQSGRNVAQAAVYRSFREGKDPCWVEPRDSLSEWPKQFAADYVGDDLIQNHMRVRDGRIVLDSGATYQVLCIVPTQRPTMPLATLAAIRNLIRQGARVVWFADPPERCPSLTNYPRRDAEFKAIVADLRDRGEIVKLPTPSYADLVPIVEASPDPPAWLMPGDAPLRFVHRRTSEADIFFVVNCEKKGVDVPVTFRIKGRRPELWDPDTGVIKGADYKQVDGGLSVDMQLPPLASTFVVFRDRTDRLPAARRESSGRVPVSIAIDGPWEVTFAEGRGAPANATFQTLRSWTEMDDPGIRNFSGIATYRTTFEWPASDTESGSTSQLDLGRVAEVCEVRLNGKVLGIGWHSPYRFDATGKLRDGENHLEVRVANLWHNRLVGDAALPKSERVTRITPDSFYERMRDRKLMDSGLLGPVRIVFSRNARGEEDSRVNIRRRSEP